MQDKTLEEIVNSIDELATRGKISRNRAFGAWFAINFHSIDEDDAIEAAAADGGNDQGIDIVFADDSSQELVVLQAFCPENFNKKTPRAKWDAVVASIPYVKNPSLLTKLGRPDIAETLSSAQKAHPDYTISVGLITLGQGSEAIDNSLQAHQASNSDKNLAFFQYAQQDIKDRYKAMVEAEAGIPDDDLEFSGAFFEDTGDYGRAWVGSVSAAELRRLHSAHQDKLFAGNVRLFLGIRKGGINEQIIKTAKETPGTFWALNNGITIVADHAKAYDDKNKNSKLNLKRFSIVNGCQTTNSLVRAEASEAKVLARVICSKSGLKNEIVRYNNSQNAVKIWTVRAVDDIQEFLRKEFAKVGITYAPKQEGARRKRTPDIIELDKVTQYLASSEQQYLLQAIDNKSELFDEPYQKLFKKGIRPSAIYMAWIIGNAADEERQSLVDALQGDPNASLLGVTSAYWIVYCTYKIIPQFTDLTSPHITIQKMKSTEFHSSVRKHVSKAAAMFYDAAVDTYDRDEFGSFKSTLRSAKFLQRIDSKMNNRIARLEKKALPDLASTCKSAKV